MKGSLCKIWIHLGLFVFFWFWLKLNIKPINKWINVYKYNSSNVVLTKYIENGS